MVKNKKSNIYVFVSIIITILSFFVLLSYYMHISNKITSVSDDLKCRMLVMGKDNVAYSFLNTFFNKLNYQCKKDDITLDASNQEQIFQTLADRTASCWYRYGEGKYDFLSKFSGKGEWCFVCSHISFKNSNGQVYEYNDVGDKNNFIYYLTHTTYKKDKDGKPITYGEYVNLKYTPVSKKEITELYKEISSLQGEDNVDKYKGLLLSNLISLNDLRSKDIDTSQNLYVVYRYNRLTSKEQAENVGNSVFYTTLAGIFIGGAIESIVLTAGTCALSVITSITGVGALIFGALCADNTMNIVKNGLKGYKTAAEISLKITKLDKITTKISSMIKFTKDYKKAKLLEKFTGDISEINSVATKLEKYDPKKAADLRKIQEVAKIMGVKNINEIKESTKMSPKAIENLYEFMKNYPPENFKNIKNNKELIKVFNELKNGKKINELSPSDKLALKDYFKIASTATIAAASGYLASLYSADSTQYVDIMTQEEFYRECGTEYDNSIR
jgi:hypothetical protein